MKIKFWFRYKILGFLAFTTLCKFTLGKITMIKSLITMDQELSKSSSIKECAIVLCITSN